MGKLAIDLFTDLMTDALPFCICWGIATIILRTFLRVAFGGKFEL